MQRYISLSADLIQRSLKYAYRAITEEPKMLRKENTHTNGHRQSLDTCGHVDIYDTDMYIDESKDAGAGAYVVKSNEIDTLANAIRRVFAEEPEKNASK